MAGITWPVDTRLQAARLQRLIPQALKPAWKLHARTCWLAKKGCAIASLQVSLSCQPSQSIQFLQIACVCAEVSDPSVPADCCCIAVLGTALSTARRHARLLRLQRRPTCVSVVSEQLSRKGGDEERLVGYLQADPAPPVHL